MIFPKLFEVTSTLYLTCLLHKRNYGPSKGQASFKMFSPDPGRLIELFLIKIYFQYVIRCDFILEVVF